MIPHRRNFSGGLVIRHKERLRTAGSIGHGENFLAESWRKGRMTG